MLGCATDTLDAEGAVQSLAPFAHVTRAAVDDSVARLAAIGTQKPPR
jgi:hypothetical protein